MKRSRLFEPELPPELPIPEDIREVVDLWVSYKKEQFRFTYKPLAFAALVERLAIMGAGRASAAIKYSMAQGWEGVYEEKKTEGKSGVKPTERRAWQAPAFALSCRSCPAHFGGVVQKAEAAGWDWGGWGASCPDCAKKGTECKI